MSDEEEKVSKAASVLGRKGGEVTSKKYGREFYVAIGKKGGNSKNKN